MRDFGVYPAAHSAFLLNLGLETPAVRMKQYCENAMMVAQYLEQSPYVERVNYPGLKSNENYALAQKYLKGCSGVISFIIKGGKGTAMQFMNTLRLASNEVHVADIRTCVLHPASETHRFYIYRRQQVDAAMRSQVDRHLSKKACPPQRRSPPRFAKIVGY